MNAHRFAVAGMREHHTFRLAGRTRRIHQCSDVVLRNGASATLHLFLVFFGERHFKKIFEIDCRWIVGYVRLIIKNHNLFQY